MADGVEGALSTTQGVMDLLAEEERAKEVGEAIYGLAIKVAKDAMTDAATPEFRLDALKVLTGYHVGTTRVKAKRAPTGGKSMSAIKDRLAAAGLGSKQ